MELEVRIVPLCRGGTEFAAEPERLRLGARGAAHVDTLRFLLPAAWADKTVILYTERGSGQMGVPVQLDGSGCISVDRSLTDAGAGRWMLAAQDAAGYRAFTRPGSYVCHETLSTDGQGEEVSPSQYEQFVQRVLSHANAADTAAQRAELASRSAAEDARRAQQGRETLEQQQRQTEAKAAEAAQSAGAAAASAADAAESSARAEGFFGQLRAIANGCCGYHESAAALRAALPAGEAGWWAVVGETDSLWVWSRSGSWQETGIGDRLNNYHTRAEIAALLQGYATLAAVSACVPALRRVNGRPLSADISLTAADVGSYTTAQTDALLAALPAVTVSAREPSPDEGRPGDVWFVYGEEE